VRIKSCILSRLKTEIYYLEKGRNKDGHNKSDFFLLPCHLNCSECLKKFINLFKEGKRPLGIVRPLAVKEDSEMNEYSLVTILKNPQSSNLEEFFENTQITLHPSKIIHKIVQVKRLVIENPSENHNLKNLASKVNLNPSYLSFKFREITGTTLESFIQRIRICSSLQHVLFEDKYIKWIARDLGWKSVPTFTNTFKKFFGITPSKLRKKLSKNPK